LPQFSGRRNKPGDLFFLQASSARLDTAVRAGTSLGTVAERVVGGFAARGHKQTYWSERQEMTAGSFQERSPAGDLHRRLSLPPDAGKAARSDEPKPMRREADHRPTRRTMAEQLLPDRLMMPVQRHHPSATSVVAAVVALPAWSRSIGWFSSCVSNSTILPGTSSPSTSE
jgi:hypothetical protein